MALAVRGAPAFVVDYAFYYFILIAFEINFQLNMILSTF